MITKSYVTFNYMLMLLEIPYMQLCNHYAFEDSSEKRGVTCQNVYPASATRMPRENGQRHKNMYI